MKIDLGKCLVKGNKVFSGREFGEKVRRDLNLERLDNTNEKIEIIIPEDTFSLNASFFLGAFGPSVRNLGANKFKEKYIFKCEDIIKESIDDGIERALKSSNVLR